MTKMIYRINQSFQTVQRGRYRRKLLTAALILLVIGAAGLAIYLDLSGADKNTGTPATGPTYNKAVAGAETFKSTYFQFSDTSKWVFMQADSTANKFTYIDYVAKLPAHAVTVYVNQTPPVIDLATTRVLPVKLINDNAFTVGDISEPCGQQFKAGEPKRVRPVTLGGTNMLCVPDSPQYTVEVGQTGGDYNLTLKRAGGSTARYVIIYRNLTATPDPGPFLRVMKTFQAL
jgi:hypothetical protein